MPRISPATTTAVSDPSTGKCVRAMAALALAMASRSTYAKADSSASGVSSISLGSTLTGTPIDASSALRRGDADARQSTGGEDAPEITSLMKRNSAGKALDTMEVGKGEVRREGKGIAILAFGPMLAPALKAGEALVSGDLARRIDITGDPALARFLRTVNQMNGKFLGILLDVRSSADSVRTAAGEIAAGNSDLSQRTEEQASSLEETASSMEELTSTVKQNADNARQANQLAATASENAVRGGEVVAQVVDTMASIDASSKKIASPAATSRTGSNPRAARDTLSEATTYSWPCLVSARPNIKGRMPLVSRKASNP